MPLIRLTAIDAPRKNPYPVLFNTAHITHVAPYGPDEDTTFVQLVKGHFYLDMSFTELLSLLDRIETVWLVGDGDPVPVAKNLIRFVPPSSGGEIISKS